MTLEQPTLSSLKNLHEFQKYFFTRKITTGIVVSEYDELFDPKVMAIEKDSIEIVTPSNINESINFRNSELISQSDISSKESYSDVWQYRFSNLAEQTSVITVIDRYMALNIIDDLGGQLKTSLERLLESLSKYNRKFTIDIYSACDFKEKRLNSTDIKTYLDAVIKNKPFFSEKKFEIKFSICKDSIFRDEAHDRMLCFDNHVIQIGKGMDIFRDKSIQNNTFTIKARKTSNFDVIYKELARNREWVYKPAG